MLFMLASVVAVIGIVMQKHEDLEEIKQNLSAAAEFLLPLARETEWPCKLELLGWLTMVRDSLGKKSEHDIH